jgi:hypothetical protein
VVLVRRFDGLDWEIPFTAALRAQCLVWGGTGNLPVPAVEGLTDHPVYRAIVDMLDPDAVVVHDLTFADLQDLAPERFAEREHALREGLDGKGYDEVIAEEATQRALVDPIDPRLFDREAGVPFLARHAFLHNDGHIQQMRSRVGGRAPYPFVNSLEIVAPPRPEAISERHTTLSAAAQLALAAEGGQITPWERTRLAQAHITQGEPAVLGDHRSLASFLFGITRSPQMAPMPFALSEAGLAWYSRPSDYDPRVPSSSATTHGTSRSSTPYVGCAAPRSGSQLATHWSPGGCPRSGCSP